MRADAYILQTIAKLAMLFLVAVTLACVGSSARCELAFKPGSSTANYQGITAH